MKKKVATKPFDTRSFEVEVRAEDRSLFELCVVLVDEPEADGASAGSRVSRAGIVFKGAVIGDLPPIDAVGLLSGDGMWVGAGGVSFLPAREDGERAVNSLQTLAE
jgi:hypothetical protein